MSLVLGPMLRYVDETRATLWVETAAAGRVAVTAGGRSFEASTFAVHGHHYAVVVVEGLEKGSSTTYSLAVDGETCWPPADHARAGFPEPRIETLDHERPLRMVFGSCRVSVPHDAEHERSFGRDALRTHALAWADEGRESGEGARPDLMLFLGDQVYADETSDAMRRFIEARRDPEQAPWWELKDYEEYAELYRLAWSDPAIRWLLATVPSAMIFDDHDIRDDWNTSVEWRQEINQTSWWHDRLVGGLASYWVYQHLGNLAPEDLRADDVFRLVVAHEEAGAEGEVDLGEALDSLVERADQEPTTYRWSYAREYGTQARLVVVDSRAARVLEPEQRSMLDPQEMIWLDGLLRGDVDHLLVGTSLPYLLTPGIHHVEALTEALAEGGLGSGRVGRLGHRLGEWVRRTADTEHWAAFQGGFRDLGEMVVELSRGRRGRAPETLVFLSGDVHHSYLARACPSDATPGRFDGTRVAQAVCSPVRNPLPGVMKAAVRLASLGGAKPTGRLLGRLVPASPLRWEVTDGPWFDNLLAWWVVEDGRVRLSWSRPVPGPDRARLETVGSCVV